MNATLNELVEFLDKLAVSLDEWAELYNTNRFDRTAVEVHRMSDKIRKSVEVTPSDA